MRDTTPRSWVISRIAMPRSRCREASRSRICDWMVTSRAVVGSSAISTSGSAASASAIITRCFMPPDNWNGYSVRRRCGSGMPTRCSHSSASAAAAAPLATAWRSSTSTIWSPQVMTGFRLSAGSWKIMPMRRPRTSRIAYSGSASNSVPPCRTLPSGIHAASGSRRMMVSAVIDLPQPDSPTMAKVSPRRISMSMSSSGCTTPAALSMRVFRRRTARTGFIAHPPAPDRGARA